MSKAILTPPFFASTNFVCYLDKLFVNFKKDIVRFNKMYVNETVFLC